MKATLPPPESVSVTVDLPDIPPASPAASDAPSTYARIRSLKLRLVAVRLTLWTLCCALLGGLFVYLTADTLSTDMLSELFTAHLPSDTRPALAWLRLCAADAIPLLVLAIAGLTYISGGLTTASLAYCALGEGAALTLLILMQTGSVTAPEGVAVPIILSLYAMRMGLLCLLRILLATRARRVSFALVSSHDHLSPTHPHISPALLTYVMTVLFVSVLTATVEGLYILLLYRL